MAQVSATTAATHDLVNGSSDERSDDSDAHELELMYIEEMKSLEEQSLGPFIVLFSTGTVITFVLAVMGQLPWAGPFSVLLGTGLAILRRFHLVREQVIRPAMLFYIFMLAAYILALSFQHQDDGPLASLALYLGSTLVIRTHFVIVQSMLLCFAIVQVFLFAHQFPTLAPALAACVIFAFVSAWNAEKLSRRYFYERCARLQVRTRVTGPDAWALLHVVASQGRF